MKPKQGWTVLLSLRSDVFGEYGPPTGAFEPQLKALGKIGGNVYLCDRQFWIRC